MCGIGGATRGFNDAGIRVLKGIDNEIKCKETYEKNNKPSKFVHEDITSFSIHSLFNDIRFRENDYLVFIACAPCQPYSRKGVQDPEDSRVRLILSINELIYEYEPDFVFVENVPGFLSFYPDIFSQFLEPFKKLTYHFSYDILNLKKYGVPQNRRRFLFLASKHSPIDLPLFTHGKGLLPYVSVRNKIQRYPPIQAGESDPDIPNHETYNVSSLTMRRLQATPPNGGGRKDWPSDLMLECHKGDTSGHWDVYGRMRWDDVGPTLTCRCINLSNGRFVHPEQNRGISVREAASLQTFKDDFILYELKTNAAKQIGNAVPPIVAYQFAKKIKEAVAELEWSYFLNLGLRR